MQIKTVWKWRIAALAASMAPLAGEWQAVQPWGSQLVLHFAFMLATPILLGLPLSLLAIVFARPQRREAVRWLAIFTASLTLLILSGFVIRPARRRAFEHLAARSEELVNAVNEYQSKHGTPPSKLKDLIPKYISEVPRTQLGAYPTYEYLAGEPAKSWDHNPWVLYVDCPGAGINFDRFIYLPLQNYPKYGYGGSLERIGSWAYVHE